MTGVLSRYKRPLVLIAVLLAVSPVFGVVLAEKVGYHEPLDVAAEKLGLKEWKLPEWSPFPDYTVPGLPDTVGYVLSGLVSVALIIARGLALSGRGRGG